MLLYEEQMCTLTIPSDFDCKLPNACMIDQGPYKSQLGIAAAGRARRASNMPAKC